MPIRSKWQLQREGVTIDTIGRLLSKTVLNPAITLPLFLLAQYSEKGRELALQNVQAFKALKVLLYGGLASWAGSAFDNAQINNFTSDNTWDWNKEIVVVTGGSDGIGAIVVQLLAEKGIKVAIMDIQAPTFDLPTGVHYFNCDLASTANIASASEQIRTKLGDPTVLINNAGIVRGKSILDSTEKDISLTFAVNTLSHYHLAQQFLPAMVRANHGMVLTVASIAGYATAPNMVDYCASKAASIAFHEGLAAELATVYKAPGVRTVVMCQGYTRTKLFEGFDKGDKFLNYMLHPETVAEDIVKAVLRGKSDHILLPRFGWFVAMKLRSQPIWFQYGLRKRLSKMMRTFQGRQIAQPMDKAD